MVTVCFLMYVLGPKHLRQISLLSLIFVLCAKLRVLISIFWAVGTVIHIAWLISSYVAIFRIQDALSNRYTKTYNRLLLEHVSSCTACAERKEVCFEAQSNLWLHVRLDTLKRLRFVLGGAFGDGSTCLHNGTHKFCPYCIGLLVHPDNSITPLEWSTH